MDLCHSEFHLKTTTLSTDEWSVIYIYFVKHRLCQTLTLTWYKISVGLYWDGRYRAIMTFPDMLHQKELRHLVLIFLELLEAKGIYNPFWHILGLSACLPKLWTKFSDDLSTSFYDKLIKYDRKKHSLLCVLLVVFMQEGVKGTWACGQR